MSQEIPRRCRLDRMSPSELAVYSAKQEIEKMPADVRLTEAQILLSQAQDKVADFIDSLPQNEKENLVAKEAIASVPQQELSGPLTGDVNPASHYAATVLIICEDGSKQKVTATFEAPSKPKTARLIINAGLTPQPFMPSPEEADPGWKAAQLLFEQKPRTMLEIGVEGDPFHPHLETSNCALMGCVPAPVDTPLPLPMEIEGTWPADCVQRAFVAGAKWWQFYKNGATMFPSERDEAAHEAVVRYGEPVPNELSTIKAAIHRILSQKYDDLCWLDIYIQLGKFVGIDFKPEMLPREQMLANCKRFVTSLLAGAPYQRSLDPGLGLQALYATIRDEYGSVSTWAIHAHSFPGIPKELEAIISALKEIEKEAEDATA